MEEIRPSHKAFWKITKALKTEGYTPIPPLKRPDGSTALDDAEVAECLADSIETQCSHASPPHDPAHIRVEISSVSKSVQSEHSARTDAPARPLPVLSQLFYYTLCFLCRPPPRCAPRPSRPCRPRVRCAATLHSEY
ncbi:hypothetical protein EVAR_62517_1 [Eumeta japonica]|uniref:Uncharacterized protein n=1 Tax=Eumeta variegata TaxID=151549 RepID=A0A4C1SEA3_EUMVA|nr:hypothetical protein EVAR_62517_1 [Eumeta japonica]